MWCNFSVWQFSCKFQKCNWLKSRHFGKYCKHIPILGVFKIKKMTSWSIFEDLWHDSERRYQVRLTKKVKWHPYGIVPHPGWKNCSKFPRQVHLATLFKRLKGQWNANVLVSHLHDSKLVLFSKLELDLVKIWARGESFCLYTAKNFVTHLYI